MTQNAGSNASESALGRVRSGSDLKDVIIAGLG